MKKYIKLLNDKKLPKSLAYCLRISDQILILGNGGVKATRTYQEDSKLSGYVMDLQSFDKVLLKAQKSGKVTIEKNMITDIQSATFET